MSEHSVHSLRLSMANVDAAPVGPPARDDPPEAPTGFLNPLHEQVSRLVPVGAMAGIPPGPKSHPERGQGIVRCGFPLQPFLAGGYVPQDRSRQLRGSESSSRPPTATET